MIFLFDLDGTLHDPKEGITRCFQYALIKAGMEPPSPDALEWVIGPPLIESFGRFFPLNEPATRKAVSDYRERYSKEGILETFPYDGVEAMLKKLKQEGHRLFVVTSKPRVYAEKIIIRSHWEELFDKVYGCELDGAFNDKAELLKHLLSVEQIQAADCVMIGDRKHDVVAAQKNGVASIGVLYGYGSREELESHAADQFAENVKELNSLLAKTY